jgi:hypothetical protein
VRHLSERAPVCQDLDEDGAPDLGFRVELALRQEHRLAGSHAEEVDISCRRGERLRDENDRLPFCLGKQARKFAQDGLKLVLTRERAGCRLVPDVIIPVANHHALRPPSQVHVCRFNPSHYAFLSPCAIASELDVFMLLPARVARIEPHCARPEARRSKHARQAESHPGPTAIAPRVGGEIVGFARRSLR